MASAREAGTIYLYCCSPLAACLHPVLHLKEKDVSSLRTADDNQRAKGSCCGRILHKLWLILNQTSRQLKRRLPVKRYPGHVLEFLKEMETSSSISLTTDENFCSVPMVARKEPPVENAKDVPFVNQAAIEWNKMRKEWGGDQSKKTHRAPREPVISWCTTYEELLSTNQCFVQPISLSEMVDFLVDIWHEEGLYD